LPISPPHFHGFDSRNRACNVLSIDLWLRIKWCGQFCVVEFVVWIILCGGIRGVDNFVWWNGALLYTTVASAPSIGFWSSNIGFRSIRTLRRRWDTFQSPTTLLSRLLDGLPQMGALHQMGFPRWTVSLHGRGGTFHRILVISGTIHYKYYVLIQHGYSQIHFFVKVHLFPRCTYFQAGNKCTLEISALCSFAVFPVSRLHFFSSYFHGWGGNSGSCGSTCSTASNRGFATISLQGIGGENGDRNSWNGFGSSNTQAAQI